MDVSARAHPAAGGFTVTEVPGGTELTYLLSARLAGIQRLAAPYLWRSFARAVARSLATLQAQLENPARAGRRVS